MACYAHRARKVSYVERASVKLDALKFFLQIAWELKAINHKKYAALAAPLAETGKMIGGWQRQLTKETPSGLEGE